MDAKTTPPVVHVVGWSGRGKTLLIERLLPHLRAHGLRVATAKHAHGGYALDREGSDSSRHAAAGAVVTALVGPDGWAVMHHSPPEAFDAVLEAVARPGIDLILVEGFTDRARHAIVLAGEREPPAAGPDDRRIRIGTDPADLSEQQLEQLVRFCLELTRS